MAMRPTRGTLLAAAAVGAALAAPAPPASAQVTGEGAMPAPPTREQCQAARASRSLPTTTAYAPRAGAPRVFAMQFKQEVRHVVSYASFRRKIECEIRERVVPRLAKGRPNVVALNEDIGLMTIATGSRGAAARATIENPAAKPSCESAGFPCAAFGALVLVAANYTKELAAYRARFPDLNPVNQAFVATTDTFARGWMQTFSDMARRYGVYILGSNNQAPFRESSDPAEIAAFADPDEPRPQSVFVATEPKVYNEVFMWGPDDVDPAAPRPLRNVVARNKKVPLTSIEELIQLTPGPRTGPAAIENVRPYALPGTKARIAFATSLPAFVYGELPPGVDPCSDTARWYMRCLDRLGANVVMQDEANPGRWGAYTAEDSPDRGAWQPLGFMSSTWRAVADPAVRFDYNVIPHLVGNLADLPFDGQTAITQRGLRAAPGRKGCHYVGNSRSFPEDPETFEIGGETQRVSTFTGPKVEFLGLAPWVVPDRSRDQLRDVAARLAPGSGNALENDYVETAIAADLPFPRVARRPSCAGAAGRGTAGGLRLSVRPRVTVAGRRTRFVFRLTGRRAASRPTIRLAGRSVRPDRRGRATLVLRLRAGRYAARAGGATARVVVRPRRVGLTG